MGPGQGPAGCIWCAATHLHELHTRTNALIMISMGDSTSTKACRAVSGLVMHS